LAATAVILIALVLYKDMSPTKPAKQDLTPRSFQVEIGEPTAKNPIIIFSSNKDKTLSALQEILKEYDGRIVQTLHGDKETQITLKLKKEKEAAFFARLKKLGQVDIKQDGFRDDQGNVVVVLKGKR
jgi:hypothetical protein